MKELIKRVIFNLRRLLKAKEITERDVCQYFKETIEKLLYKGKHNSIICRKPFTNSNRVFIRFNVIKSDRQFLKHKTKRRGSLLGWSRQIVLYQKRRRSLERNSKNDANQTKLHPDDLRRLNERLEIYRNKYVKPLETNPNITRETLEFEAVTDSTQIERISCKSTDKNDLNAKRKKFLDGLLSKLKIDDKSQGDEANVSPVVKESPAANWKVPSVLIRKRDESDSSTSSDFCEFNDAAAGMLPTPVVPKHHQSAQSAFVSERLDRFLRENSLEDRANIELPKVRKIVEGLVYEGSRPPKIKMPKIFNEIGRPRTVAEKRLFLERNQNIKYYIIENENTVYRELKKRSKPGTTTNENIIEQLQNSDVPFTRDCWRAASWLHTANGKFYFQTLTVDGENYKLIGSKGNHYKRFLGIQRSTLPIRSNTSGCPSSCKQNEDIVGVILPEFEDDITDNEDIADWEPKHKMPRLLLEDGESAETSEMYKPGQLSRKCLANIENKIVVGDVEVYKMPQVQLEVFPEINQPLDDLIKSYLKLLLASQRITRERAEFSVSTLSTDEESSNKKKSLIFNIPYLNDQKTILVRKILKRNEKYDAMAVNEMSFRARIDPNDTMAVECGAALTEMIDSVALSLSEDTFTKNDPDIDYDRNEILNKVDGPQLLSGAEKANNLHTSNRKTSVIGIRLLKELKRLNATIVQAEENYDEADECKEDFCRFGCICQSLAGISSWKPHCSKVGCMLSCVCDNNIISHCSNLNNSLSEEDAMLIREKAIANLAKVEKEFCSTLVLTENDTYLLNDSNSDKRRLKRMPKRFNDFVKDDVNAQSLIRHDSSADTNSAEVTTPTKKLPGSSKSFKHCNVAVRRLDKLDNIEPWCMVHCLYKCFCKGEAIEGEPFTSKKEETNKDEEIIYAPKPRYSFDKDEEVAVSHTISDKRKYHSAGFVSGSRFVPIPASIFHDINRKRANSIRAMARFEESGSKRLLLQNRIVQCAIAHRNDIPIAKPKIITETQNVLKVVPEKPQPPVSPIKPTVESLPLVKPLVDIDVFEREPVIKNSTESDMLVITSDRSLNSISTAESPCKTSTLLPTNCQNLKLKCPAGAVAAEAFHQNATPVESLLLDKPLVDIDVFEREPVIKNSTESDMPVITSVRSLNSISTAESPCQTSTLLPTNCRNFKWKCPAGAVAAEAFHQNAMLVESLLLNKPLVDIDVFEREPVIKNSTESDMPVITSDRSLNPISTAESPCQTSTLLPTNCQNFKWKCPVGAVAAEAFHQNAMLVESLLLNKPLVDIDVFEREPVIKNSTESDMPVITSDRSLNPISTAESPCQTSTLLPINCQNLKLKCPAGAVAAEGFHQNAMPVESLLLDKPLVDIDVFEREPVIKNSTESDMPVITSVRSLNSISTAESPCQTSTLLPTNCQNLKLKCPGGAVAAERCYRNVIAKLNSTVTKTMQSICAIQNRNSINIPEPAARTLSSLQWKYFLQAFVKGLVFVWEVHVNRRTIIAATKKNVMPQVPDAVSATNIRALPREKLPLIGQMLIDGLLTDKMKMLSVLMFGNDCYWHIIGFLNRKQDYLTQRCVLRPTPETHPRVSSKINALFKLLFLREMNLLAIQPTERFANHNTNTNLQAASPQPTAIRTIAACNEARTSAISQATFGIPISQLPPSNLAIRSDIRNQTEPIVIPIPFTADHYWFMLKIFDDFSHIYFPESKNFLSYDRIREGLTIASNKKKTVRLGKITDNVDVYVTSYSNYYVYIGPFYEQRELNLILYQNIDGRIILREDFEKSHNIKRIENTVGYWLRIKNSILIYDDIPATSAVNEYEACRKAPIDSEQDSSSSDSSNLLLTSTEPPPAKHSNISRDVPESSDSVVLGVELFPNEFLEVNPPTSFLQPTPEVVKQPTLPVTATVKITAATSSPGASNIKSFAMTNSNGISHMTTTSGFVESSVDKPTNLNTASKSTFAAWQQPPLANLEDSSLSNDSNEWVPITLTSIDSEAKRKSTGQISYLTDNQAEMPMLQRHTTATIATPLGSSLAASPNGFTNIDDVSTTTMTTTTPRSPGSPTGEIRCDECNQVFTKIDYLAQHNKAFHNDEQPFRCNRCDKRFSNKKFFDLHYVRHSAPQKPHRCHYCPKQFHHKTDLQQHLDSHTGRRPYVCDICSMGFKRPDHLRRHSSTHKPKPPKPVKSVTVQNHSALQKPHQCHLCPKQFNRKINLQQHLGSHNDRRPYICDICSMGFKRPGHLRRHSGTHKPKPPKPGKTVTVPNHSSLQKPHQCHWCPKQFHRKIHLRQHLASHNDGRPYVCDICSMGFKRPDHLRRHSGTHNPKLPKHVKIVTVPNRIPVNTTPEFTNITDFPPKTANENKVVVSKSPMKTSPESNTPFDTHYAKHSALKTLHQCHFCPKQFHQKTHLQQHLDSHSRFQALYVRHLFEGF